MERPARRRPLAHKGADPLREGPIRRVLITGANGQLGNALAEVFAGDEITGVDLDSWDVSLPAPVWLPDVDLVLHAAAWTNVDAAEDDPQGAAIANIGGTQNVAAIGKPLVYYSTDYVFDGTKRTPYVESDGPSPQGAYGRTKLGGEAAACASGHAWVLRTSWLFGWTSTNFVRTMLRLAAERDEVAVVDDQRGCPTYVGHLAAATLEVVDARLPYGVYHLAAQGECSWADFAEAIFEEAGVACRVRRITTEELGRPAPRPAYSVLRSEQPGTPVLPHWRDGLRACLERLEEKA